MKFDSSRDRPAFEVKTSLQTFVVALDQQDDLSPLFPLSTCAIADRGSRSPDCLLVLAIGPGQIGNRQIQRSLSKEQRANISLPDGFDESPRQVLRIASRAHTFRAKVAVREQTIRTSTTATTILTRNQLVVRQRISYDVAWEPLSQIRVTVPAAIEGDVRFFSNEDRASDDKLGNDAGVELATSKKIQDDGSREFRVDLPGPEPAIGEFEVVARFVVELPEDPSPARKVRITVPLIQSADAEYARVRFRYLKQDRIDARISDEAWIRQHPTGSTTVWRVDEPKIVFRVASVNELINGVLGCQIGFCHQIRRSLFAHREPARPVFQNVAGQSSGLFGRLDEFRFRHVGTLQSVVVRLRSI